MEIAFQNAMSIAPAAPGSYVVISTEADRSYPVIAWALVSTGGNEYGKTETTVQPVFLREGETFTTSEWYQDMGPEHGVKAYTS